MYIKEEPHDDELIVQVDPLLLPSDIREDGADKVCWVKRENKMNEDQDKEAEILIINDVVTQEPYNVKSEIQTYESDPISDYLSIKNESSPYDTVSKCYTMLLEFLLLKFCHASIYVIIKKFKFKFDIY